jgi:hypothetical protein
MAELKNMIERLKGEITGPGVMSDREMGVLNNAMSPNMNDNEPRFDSKSLQEKMFTIEANIENLTKEYDMNVRNKQYEQAQQIADMIDKLQMQKIQMQAAPITDMMMRPGEQMPPQDMMQRGAISDREMEMFKKASSPMARGGIMAFADGGSAEAMMSQEMSPEEGMSEIEMAKEEIMQELFIPLAENGYEEQVQIIMQFPADSPESMQAQQVLAQALSEDPEFDMEDFQMAVSIVAPQ